MSYEQLAYVHLATILPLVAVGAWLLSARKGTATHKALGRVYMTTIFLSAAVTLFMPARVGPQFFGHFGYIHLLTAIVLFSVPVAWLAAKKGDISRHKAAMRGVYFGGILVAGGFALLPGRMLPELLARLFAPSGG